MSENLIISGNPVPKEWDLQKGIEDGSGFKWDVQECITSVYTGINKITRYIKYFTFPFKLFVTRNKYKRIVTKDQFFGLVLAMYIRLFHVKKYPDIYIMTFIYKPKKGALHAIFEKFVRYSINAKCVKKIFVFSESEVEYYRRFFKVNKNLFVKEILGIKDTSDEIKAEKGNYYVAAGRSNRDYQFLKRAWTRKEKLYIVSEMEKGKDTEYIIHKRNCFKNEFLTLLAGAKASIISLSDEHISSGQLVILQSSMLGIPCIATKNDTVCDYIENNKNGFVIEKTAENLEDALNQLENEKEYNRLSFSCKEIFKQKFSLYEMGKRIGSVVKEN